MDELHTLVYCPGGQPARSRNNNTCSGNLQQPAIVGEAFPNTPSWFFWSGSPSPVDSNHAWGVNFADGVAITGRGSGYARVRLVRGGQ